MHPIGFASYGYGYGMPVLMTLLLSPIFWFFALIVLALKGYCLWHAAKRNETWWFIALLVLNTAGILELVYIIFFLQKFHKKHHPEHHDHSHDHDFAPHRHHHE